MNPAIDEILIWAGRAKSNTTARKSILKLVKLQSLVAKCCKMRKKIALQIQQILYTFGLRAEVCTTFGSKVVQISARNTKAFKIREIRRAIFSAFYNISRLNLQFH